MNLSLLYTLDVSHSTGGNPVRLSILWIKLRVDRPIWFCPLMLAFSNSSRGPGQSVALHMPVKSKCLQLLLKNKLTNFTASVNEVFRGLFMPPPKLRPQKNVTMFTNRKGVYRMVVRMRKVMLHRRYEPIPRTQQHMYFGNTVHKCQNDDIPVTDPGVLKTDDFVRRSVQCRTQQELLLNRIFSTDTLKSECI